MEVGSATPALLDTAIRVAVLKQVQDQLKSQGQALLELVRPGEAATGDADGLPHLGRYVDVRV